MGQQAERSKDTRCYRLCPHSVLHVRPCSLTIPTEGPQAADSCIMYCAGLFLYSQGTSKAVKIGGGAAAVVNLMSL